MKKLLFCALLAVAGPAFAQSGDYFPSAPAADVYPSRTITIIVPFAAGGPADVLARQLRPLLAKELGQAVMIENVGGASGQVGSTRAARAAPDGYTLVMGHSGTHAANAALFPKMAYDPARDFIPVAHLVSMSSVLLVRNGLPVDSVASFIDFARKNAKTINVGTAGSGSASHLAAAMFFNDIKVDPIYIPYKGTGPAMIDLMGGVLDAMFDMSNNAVPVAAGGKVRPLLVTASSRLKPLPNVPTARESCCKDFVLEVWFGLFAPKGTPSHAIDRLGAAAAAALKDVGLRARLEESGAHVTAPEMSGPAHFGALVSLDIKRYVGFIKTNNIVAE